MSTCHPKPSLFAVALSLTVCALLVSDARSEDPPNPIAELVRAGLKDENKPFTLVVSLQVREGNGAKLEAAFEKVYGPTRKEKGCLTYDLNRDTKSPTQYLLYERWQNLPALEAHLKTNYITGLLKELGELLAAPSDIRVFVTAGN